MTIHKCRRHKIKWNKETIYECPMCVAERKDNIVLKRMGRNPKTKRERPPKKYMSKYEMNKMRQPKMYIEYLRERGYRLGKNKEGVNIIKITTRV